MAISIKHDDRDGHQVGHIRILQQAANTLSAAGMAVFRKRHEDAVNLLRLFGKQKVMVLMVSQKLIVFSLLHIQEVLLQVQQLKTPKELKKFYLFLQNL